MAQINPPKRLASSREGDLREDHLTDAYARSTSFFDEHRTAIVAVVVGLIVLALVVIGYQTWRAAQSEEAQQYLGAILVEYERGNYQAALDGTDATPGLLEIADDYGSTATGEQATFFAADALFQLGRLDEARAMFEDYDGGGLLEASALAGQAAIYEVEGDPARAAELYERAAGVYDSPASGPAYLLDAGRAHLAAGDAAAAEGVLQRVLDEYGDAPEAEAAQVELGRAEAAATAAGTATGDVRPAPAAADTDAAAGAPAPGLQVEEVQ
ncbi:tetratricopeptide repeat protein [Rubrivirga sp. S365]|uniref:tetratricopeptide repeat protein n=1 Tax=Rubrivirga sp. S365 TaxID=3076080 RepID=UPI0028C5D101|nr:tetratricopeptide repeat protein [Rubrivirga sp. S365]MDT7857545.1 tetratricopeptide repeat protein [Rubrivirga sp. S365]